MYIKEPPKDRPLDSNFKKPAEYVYVVVGDGNRAGTIKTIPFRKEFSSPILTTEKTQRGIRTKVQADYEDRGWRLLEDCYSSEPDLEADMNGEKVDRDECRRRFYGFMSAFRDGPQSGMKKKPLRKEYLSCIVPGFPDDMLPKYCRDLAHNRNPLAGVYDPVIGGIVDKTVQDEEKPAESEKAERPTRAQKSAK